MSKDVATASSKVATRGSITDPTSTSQVATHPLDPEDAAITAAMRAMVSSRTLRAMTSRNSESPTLKPWCIRVRLPLPP